MAERQDPGVAEPLVRVEAGFEREWPGASASATSCVLNAYVLASLVEHASQAWLREEGLPSLTAFNVLTVLHGAGQPLQPSTIANRLMVTPGTLTGILDTLERAGLARRQRHTGDGRMRWVTLTPKGQATVETLRPRIHAAERRLVADVSAQEQTLFVDILARMQRAARTLTFPEAQST